ncbi:MAG TPA: M15 family metallopeptidase [Kofleriaceae bacterium]|nr:M15 family metallopeptidase [Kofleriaceae bacterium]
MKTSSRTVRLSADRSAATGRLHTHLSAVLLGAALLSGCGVEDEAQYGEATSAVNVVDYTTSTCSTSAVLGLSTQIADEISCMSPTLLSRFTPTTRLQITSNAVLPYLHSTAKTNLVAVTQSTTVQVNSAFRTVAQQYLLYRWYQLGRCGITAAATPGNSNHESGRALDVQNYSSVISAMAARGWSHNVPGDPVHFDHLSSPDSRGKDVLAFQRLWNRNHPTDKIAEDGAYGPQTEARLKASPATGFATGATCAAAARLAGADVVMIDGPDRVAPGVKVRYAVTVDNTSATDWPATTKLRVAGGGTSELYDAASWTSPAEYGEIGVDIAAGGQGTFDVEVMAPAATEEKPVFTQLELTDGTTSLGTLNIALTVTPNGDHGTSNEADDVHDDGVEVTGGCSTGGGAGWGALALAGLALLRRRRRA